MKTTKYKWIGNNFRWRSTEVFELLPDIEIVRDYPEGNPFGITIYWLWLVVCIYTKPMRKL